MHTPTVVVFEIRRPWPKRRDRNGWRYWPPVLVVWHREPTGHDSHTVCKGMSGTGLSWHNLRWALAHWRHLHCQWPPFQRVRHWLFTRCGECGFRFLWKQGRFGYMSSDEVLHDKCMALREVRSQLADLTAYFQLTDDNNARWRAEYRLSHLDKVVSDTGEGE